MGAGKPWTNQRASQPFEPVILAALTPCSKLSKRHRGHGKDRGAAGGQHAGGRAGWCTDLNNNNNDIDACQPRLGACGASLSPPGRLVLSDLIRVGSRQMVNVTDLF